MDYVPHQHFNCIWFAGSLLSHIQVVVVVVVFADDARHTAIIIIWRITIESRAYLIQFHHTTSSDLVRGWLFFFQFGIGNIHMAKWKKRRYVWGERQSVKMRLTVEARISWGQQPIRKLLHTLPSENLSVFLFSPERKGKYEDCRTEKLHHGAEHRFENHFSTHHSARSPSTDRAWPASDPWPSFCTNLSAKYAEFSR